MFVTFLKRLVGADEEAKAASERFERGLNGLGNCQKELTKAGEDLDKVLKRVADRQQEIISQPGRTYSMSAPKELRDGGPDPQKK